MGGTRGERALTSQHVSFHIGEKYLIGSFLQGYLGLGIQETRGKHFIEIAMGVALDKT